MNSFYQSLWFPQLDCKQGKKTALIACGALLYSVVKISLYHLESKRLLSPRPLAVKNRHHGFLWKILQGQATSTLSSTVVEKQVEGQSQAWMKARRTLWREGNWTSSLQKKLTSLQWWRLLHHLFSQPQSFFRCLLRASPDGLHMFWPTLWFHISPWSHTSPVGVSLQVQTSGKHKPTMLPSIATSKR